MRRSIGRITRELELGRCFADLSPTSTLGLRAGVSFVRARDRYIGETAPGKRLVCEMADLSVRVTA